jgi:hypothetical protein
VHLNYDGEDAKQVKEVMDKETLSWRSFVDRGAIAAKWKPAGTTVVLHPRFPGRNPAQMGGRSG